jgi:6-phosphogluconolactonase
VEQHSTWRITFTYPLLNAAANLMFLVSGGGEKPEIVRKALREPAANLPCQKVQPINGKLMWYLDNAAGSKL